MHGFGARLKQLRQASGLTQKQIAERIWVSKAAVSNYELYDRCPTPEILIKLARVFHVSTDYLLGIEQQQQQILEVSDLTAEDMEIIENLIEHLRRKNLEKSKPIEQDL